MNLEAILFTIVAASFGLIKIFIDDLSDPFGGTWSVHAALDDLQVLIFELEELEKTR